VLIHVQLGKKALLFQIREEARQPAPTLRVLLEAPIPSSLVLAVGGEVVKGIMEGVACQDDLFHVVGAGRPLGRLADLLDRRQQEADQDADDGDHHEEFNKREGYTSSTSHG